MKFELHILGAGSALSTEYKNSNFLFRFFDEEEKKWKNYLFDCGTTAPDAYCKGGMFYNKPEYEPDGIIVTHTHADHAGGIEWFGFRNKFILYKKLEIYTTPDVWGLLWDGPLQSMRFGPNKSRTSQEFFDLHLSTVPKYFDKGLWIRNSHMSSAYPTYGLALKIGDFVWYISGDTKFDSTKFGSEFWQEHFEINLPHLIFHEVQFFEPDPEPVHTLYSELRTLPHDVKKRILLYHYSNMNNKVTKDGFKGYIFAGNTPVGPCIRFDSDMRDRTDGNEWLNLWKIDGGYPINGPADVPQISGEWLEIKRDEQVKLDFVK